MVISNLFGIANECLVELHYVGVALAKLVAGSVAAHNDILCHIEPVFLGANITQLYSGSSNEFALVQNWRVGHTARRGNLATRRALQRKC
jgi:hypothetical protein